MGEVWLAEDSRLGRKVALKLLPAEFTEDSERLRRFTQEAKAASALNHPNIIAVHDIGECETGRFIVMEFVSGRTLRAVIATDNSLETLFALGSQMAKALSAAHTAGIAHRDIKPDNIMVRDDGYVKMLDFGLARLLPTTSSDPEAMTLAQQTTPGTVMGTLAYMSPEQASGQTAGPPSDVFALGIVLYELATGQHPFKSETMIGYLHSITSQEPTSLTSIKPDLPPALDELILRMLQKDPNDRPTAAQVGQVLQDIERFGKSSILPARTILKKSATTLRGDDEEGFWVAVLPFKHRGGNADLQALAEGLSEDIITGLSRFSYLHVIAHSSTLRFTSETTDVRSIGKQLGARYVMDGSVRQAGSTLRLVVQLIDATTGAHLWAETYDRQIRSEEIFELQDELVPRIVSTIADWYGVLTHSMSEAVRLKPLDQLTPYEALLRSFGYYERVTAEEQAAARSALERAIEQSPGSADAWAMLSMIYGEEHRFDYNVLPDPLGRSLDAARRAVNIAPSNHFAHLALAQALFFRKEFEAFRSAAERAISLNPMDGATLEYLGHLICFSGDWETGSEIAEHARQLNPNHPGWYWAVPFYQAFRKGDYAGARAFAVKVDMPNDICLTLQAAVYGQLGEHELAEKAVQELLAITPDFAQVGRRKLEKWYLPELVEPLVDGLRRAGLEIEGEPTATPSASRITSSQSRTDEGFWVAVLPFQFAGSPDLATLADGLSEEIVRGLSRFSYLRVIARSSTLRFSSERPDVRTVGRALGARYILEGSVRQAGSVLRVSVQLVDASTGAHLWAETYDRSFRPEEIFAVQDDLVPRIVSTVADQHGVLPHSMSEVVRTRDPDNLTPYETVLRGFRYYEGVTASEHAALRTALERALEQAPGNVDCLAMLSIMYCDEHKFGFNPLPDSLGRALATAQRAVEAAPTNPFAYEALSQALFFRREFDSFRHAAERAMALNPMDGATNAFMGLLIAFTGDWDYGCAIAERATQLNPYHPGWYWNAAFYNAYRKCEYEDALSLILKVNMPGFFYQHVNRAAVYGQLGELEAASKALEELLALKPDFSSTGRVEMGKWLQPEFVEHMIDGLRKAGLKMDEEGISLTTSTPGAISSEVRADEGFWVAVLPFKHRGDNADLEALAEGLSEDINTGLSRFSYLRVIARGSTLRYASHTSDLRAVGKELGARYVMEGNLRKSGTTMRLAVHLVDALTGAQLWAETYEQTYDPASVFELQDELVPRIVATVADLHGVLAHSMSQAVQDKPLDQLTPYEALMRSFGYSERVTVEVLADVLRGLELAVQKVPGYADAWAMLASLYSQDYGQGFNLHTDSLARAEAAGRKAVTLAPSNHLAWFGLAGVHFFQKELQSLRHAAERAIALNKMDGHSLAYLGELLTFAGDFERGMELAQRAKRLNPHHPGWYWYVNFFQAYKQRDYRAALDFARKVNLPGHWAEHMLVAAASGQLGEHESAAKAASELLKLRPNVATTLRKDMEKWWISEEVDHLIEGLRKAGLEIDGQTAPLRVIDHQSEPHVVPTNLPKERTRFIGRAHELDYCARLFDDTRLMTLTGLGGCGKTRLAVKLAESVSHRFPAGVWFVDLTPLSESSQITSAVSQALDLKEEPDKSLDDLIALHISDQKILLVIDNCEHLLSACGDFVDKILSSCSEVRILATSREPLRVPGERVVALPPLGVPAPNSENDLPTLQAADAVKLFIDRAQQVRSEFSLTSTNAAAISDVCRRLDGIPLAIELAAARVKVLSVEQIRLKLDDRFKLLAATGRTLLPRHQTLRTVIEWSYDQLKEEEQRVVRALSIFAGGWNLQLAMTVAGGLDEFEMLELHSQLVDKSIVVAERERGGVQRYGFLETVRQFLLEQLEQKNEDRQVRESHFHAMLDLAEQAYAERITREEYWSETLGAERDNLRVALDYARAIDSERYLKLVGALAWFWIVKTHLFEGREHLTAALASSAVEPSRTARARALWGAAQIFAIQGNASEARAWMDEALSAWRNLGDTREIALALEGIGWTHFFSSEDDEACVAFEECLRLQRVTGDKHLIIRAMVGLAQVLVALGRTAEAKPMAREIINFSRPHHDKRSEHFGWHYLADCELILGNCRESLDLYQQSLHLAEAIGDKVEVSFEVQGVAMSLAGLGQRELAVRLAGAVRAEWDRSGIDIHVRFWDALLDRYIGAAQRSMSAEDYEREWSQGRSMSFEQTVARALDQGISTVPR